MREQDYILKKFVRATSAAEALKKDKKTPVTEVFLTSDKPVEVSAHAVGFKVYSEEGIPCECQNGIPDEMRKR
jgi:hypothetical protein